MSICVLMADSETRENLQGLLAELQLEVVAAASSSVYRNLARERRFAVVICDTKLPDGSWVDVFETLTHEEAPSFIVTSRLADDRLWVDVLHRGAYDVLVQPFDRSEVARVISLASDGYRRRREDANSVVGPSRSKGPIRRAAVA